MANTTSTSDVSLEMLVAQRDELDRRIAEVRERTRESALVEVRNKMATFQITASELGLGVGRGRPLKKPRAAVAPKFRDPDTGSTWSGRGKPPKWIAGKDRDLFVI